MWLKQYKRQSFLHSTLSYPLEWSCSTSARGIEIDLRLFPVPWLSCLALIWEICQVEWSALRVQGSLAQSPLHLAILGGGSLNKSRWTIENTRKNYLTRRKWLGRKKRMGMLSESLRSTIDRFVVLSRPCRFCLNAFCLDSAVITWDKSMSKDLCAWSRVF